MKKSYADQIRESFLKEFNNNLKQSEAELKQNPFRLGITSTGYPIEICLS